MFKILLLILALAAYGAYTLLGKFVPGAVDAGVAHVASGESSASSAAGGIAWSAFSTITGLPAVPMPDTGCQSTTLTGETVDQILESLPEGQRILLRNMLETGGTLIPVNWYNGELGIGLCVPSLKKLVVLPDKWRAVN